LLLIQWLLLAAVVAMEEEHSKPNCSRSCGKLTNIPYPFGVGKSCSMEIEGIRHKLRYHPQPTKANFRKI
ncbi:hypothetical protein CCACVL1_03547, partial [Corchorus capsularis]